MNFVLNTHFDKRHPCLWLSPRTRDTHICRAFGSGVVTTCFNYFDLSRLGIELRCPACEANVLPTGPLQRFPDLIGKVNNLIGTVQFTKNVK